MKYIKCVNYLDEVSFVNVDKIVNITKNLDGFIAIVTVNAETFYTDNISLKNPIELAQLVWK